MKNLIYNFLKKTQKYTHTDNVYLAKYGSYLLIGNIAGIILSFVLSIAFAQLLSKEIYGQYRYILAIVNLLTITSLQGINAAIIQGTAQGFEKTAKTGFKTKLKWSLLGSFIALGLGTYFWLKNNVDFALIFLIVGVFSPLYKSGEVYQFYLDGKRLFNKKVSYNILIHLFSTLSLILTLFLTKNLVILILVYFVSYSVLRTLSLILVLKKYPPNNRDNPEMISYGKHLSMMQVLGLLSQELDKILIFPLLGASQLAIYSFAILPVQHLRNPLQNIQELALPKLSNKSSEYIKKNLPQKLVKATILILMGIIVYVVIIPFLYKVFYPQYIESIPYSQLYALTLLAFPISMMQLSLQAKIQTKSLYKINIFLPIIRIFLLVVLVQLYGIFGVISSSLLSYLFQFGLVLYFFKKM